MTALTRALKVNVNVAYLDGHTRKDGEVTVDFVKFENATEPEEPINLLYRCVNDEYQIIIRCDSNNCVVGPVIMISSTVKIKRISLSILCGNISDTIQDHNEMAVQSPSV